MMEWNHPRERGLYGKYKVERTDGKSGPGKRHSSCEYFILDLTHDPYARAALRAYAAACANSKPELSHDLYVKLSGGLAGDFAYGDGETP